MIHVRTNVRPRVHDRIFPPLPANHPLIDVPCAVCYRCFEEGDRIAAVILGPDISDTDGEQMSNAERASRGLYYNAECAAVHWPCTGWREEEIEDGMARGAHDHSEVLNAPASSVTVGELRRMIAGLHDDEPVLMQAVIGERETFMQPVFSARIGTHPRTGGRAAVLLVDWAMGSQAMPT